MKTLNRISKEGRKDRASALKGCICEILKCSADQYAELQYREGLKYLRHYLPGDAHTADLLTRSRVFWNWWKNHWTNRDETFIALNERCPLPTRQMAVQMYVEYNNGRILADSIHPNSAVLSESYAQMITEFVCGEIEKEKA